MKKQLLAGSIGALAALAAMALTASPARAGSAVLGTSGWTATWPDTKNVTLDVLDETADTLTIRKSFNFTDLDSVPIVFQQTKAGAPALIKIDEEVLNNNSGEAWSSFTFSLLGGRSGNANETQFNTDLTNSDGGFSTTPFDTQAFSDGGEIGDNSPRQLDVSGGTLANGGTWNPGNASGALYIATGPVDATDKVFTFKELPHPGGHGPPPPPHVIPLPGAVWMGLSTLACLGAFSGVKKLRKA
ncbi:MAG TPA: hypothetical protein VIL86_12865 [Tepidisphaeraceae bacterium]|jgi:hypothetical protein